jgi:hypothetical protein
MSVMQPQSERPLGCVGASHSNPQLVVQFVVAFLRRLIMGLAAGLMALNTIMHESADREMSTN